jgi:tetratricopeptide (TPR) repeat protein
MTASFSPDATRVLTASADRTARIWDSESGKELVTLRGHEDGVRTATFSPDARRVLTASSDKTARIWDSESGKELVAFRAHEGALTAASFSPDGKRILTASWDKTARIWDSESGKELVAFRGHNDAVSTATFSPDARRVLTASADGTARIWDSESGKELVAFRGHNREVRTGSFSPDGKRVLTASDDNTACIWDSESGKELVALRGHEDRVWTADFSPDARRVLTASNDKTARIWDSESGKELVTLRGPEAVVASFSPDARRVVTAFQDGTLRLWPLDVVPTAVARKPRDLTADEVERFEIGTPEERRTYALAWDTNRLSASIETLLGQWKAGATHEGMRNACALELDILWRFAVESQHAPARDAAVAIAGKFIQAEIARGDPGVGETLAEVLWKAGEKAKAVAFLETFQGRPDTPPAERLAEYRAQVFPDLLTCASIDAALDAPELLVREGSDWRFFSGSREPSTGLEWTDREFDDSAWQTGPSPFGYGAEPLRTAVDGMRGSFTTLYLRKRFRHAASGRFQRVILRVTVDDGFVAYLNGSEIARLRAGEPGTRLAFDAVASATAPEPPASGDFAIDPDLLVPGENCLTVQGLNQRLDSSDFVLLPRLMVEHAVGSRDRALYEGFLGAASAEEPRARSRRLYFEGRLLQRQGKHREAILKLEESLQLDGAFAEPHLRAAECRRALGESQAAEERLRRMLGRFAIERRIVDLWFLLAAVDSRLTPRQLVEMLPAPEPAGDPPPVAEIRWALARLVAGEGIRVDCGGEERTDDQGRTWSADRFLRSGRSSARQEQAIQGSADPEPYRTEVSFFRDDPGPRGYSIPIPPGRYKVTLGFAEVFFREPGRRSFDVAIEGTTVLKSYEPKVDTAETFSFEVEAADGFLDIGFVHGKDNPQVSLLVIEP